MLQITDDNDEETAEHDSAVGVDVSSEAQFPGRRDATPTQTEVVDERSANRVAVTSATPKMPVIGTYTRRNKALHELVLLI